MCIIAWISGKKINYGITLLVITGIVFFNLLAPYGKVLFEIGPLQITQGSLFAGLRKAFILEGLVMLSGTCIKSDLRLPGKIGALLSQTLKLLEKMQARKHNIKAGRIIEGIDNLMLEMEADERLY